MRIFSVLMEYLGPILRAFIFKMTDSFVAIYAIMHADVRNYLRIRIISSVGDYFLSISSRPTYCRTVSLIFIG